MMFIAVWRPRGLLSNPILALVLVEPAEFLPVSNGKMEPDHFHPHFFYSVSFCFQVYNDSHHLFHPLAGSSNGLSITLSLRFSTHRRSVLILGLAVPPTFHQILGTFNIDFATHRGLQPALFRAFRGRKL